MDAHQTHNLKKLNRLLVITILLLACAAAVYFRFVNLRQSPGWYSDEGNPIDLAENWMQGKWQNYGVVGAPFSQRPPLYMYVISAAMNLFGVDIGVTRGVSATASLVCLALAAWIAWKTLGQKEGILTLWVGAIAPWIVTFGRLGLTYNLMAPFFLFSLIAVWFYIQKPAFAWLAAASLSAALAFSTDYLGILCGLTIGLALLVKHHRALIWFVLIFIGTLTLVMLPVVQANSNIFFTDLWYTIINRGGVQSTSSWLVSILINYSELLRRESWILVSLCGLFLIKDNSLRNILLTAVGLSLLVVTKAYTPVGIGLHYLMHLFPIFTLGLAVFMLRAFEFLQYLITAGLSELFSRFPKLPSLISSLMAALIVFTPLAWMFLSSYSMSILGINYIFTGNDDLRLTDVRPAEEARVYIATHVKSDELVVGSPVLIWGLPTMARADFMTALACTGQTPQNFINVEINRCQYDLSLTEAEYVILDPLAEEFAPRVLPGMDTWLEEIHGWPVVFQAGDIRVYHRQ
jgi:hypothetical protein